MKRVCSVAALVSFVPDVAIVDVLEDDRLARKAPEVWQKVCDEISWVGELEGPFWTRLSYCLSNTSPDVLRDLAVAASHVAGAYMYRKTFNVALDYPWRLCAGDIEHNLTRLILLDTPPADIVAQKIHYLASKGWPRADLVRAIELLGDCHWTTTSVEQGHGSAAIINKKHKT